MNNNAFWRICRLLHWVIGAFILAMLSFFAITGFMLNNPTLFDQAITEIEWQDNIPENIPLPELNDDPNAPIAPLPKPLTAWLNQRLPYPLNAWKLKIEAPEIQLDYKGAGSEASVIIDSDSRQIELYHRKNGIIALANNLHRGRYIPPVWKYLIDIMAVLTLIVSLSGLALLFIYRKQRPSTWLLASTGITLPLILVLLFIHY